MTWNWLLSWSFFHYFPENARERVLSDRNLESTPSRLDSIFRSLRNGRHGHRLNLWMDDSLQNGGSSSSVPQGLEEVLVSQLRRPAPDIPPEQNASALEPKSNGDVSQLQEPEAHTLPDNPVENNANHGSNDGPPPTSVAIDGSSNTEARPVTSDSQSQTVDMQYEHNEATVRDVEAVSQESSGSGATLGESLRSLDVEIGSADGHDDGGERQGSALDPQAARTRRTNQSFGNSAPGSGRDASLHSVTEVSENSSREAEQDGSEMEQQVEGEAGSGSIDPAFLDALPEELRAEVLSAQQGQVAQPPSEEPQNNGDIDPEFLAALPPDIRAEVLAQQQAQRVQQSHELEGQPVEMDTVSIIATFPSELREEVHFICDLFVKSLHISERVLILPTFRFS